MSTYKCDSCRKVYKIKAKPYMCNNCDFIYCKSCYKKLPYEYKDSRNLEFCPRCQNLIQKKKEVNHLQKKRNQIHMMIEVMILNQILYQNKLL